ncbi:MAG: hypothetical protein ISR44_09240 [Rhodospirillales bacterium]|nr:hypothetical protein [Rhodospirillales bacterium]
MRKILPAFLMIIVCFPAKASEIDHVRQYQACMALAEREADDAFDAALVWRELGGGDAADHCIAKALLYLKQYAESAARFEALAQKVVAEPGFKADLLGHAAQGWLLADDPERADDVLSAALGLKPDDTDLLVDRGLARAEMHRYAAAETDFTHAIGINPRRAEAFVFRAAARRYMDDLNNAAADTEQALLIDPENPLALLERGIIRRLSGNDEGAREDWLLVIEVSPDTQASRTAQTNLQKMDAGLGQ